LTAPLSNCITQNASIGTDHGAASNVYLISGSLKKPGLYNELPDLQDLTKIGDLKHTVDFRSVYATLLKTWMQTDERKILDGSFPILDFV